MRVILFLPTQGPHLERRGPEEKYDWREQCRLAAGLQKATPDSVIYVPSAFQQAGGRSELEYYGEQLHAAGVPDTGMLLDPHGYDTVEQCELALALAARNHSHLIAISCRVHSRRVRYLLKGHDVEHIGASGTPNRWLQFTHVVLGIVFPILDLLGLRGWWKRRIARRRLQGKQ